MKQPHHVCTSVTSMSSEVQEGPTSATGRRLILGLGLVPKRFSPDVSMSILRGPREKAPA